MILLTHFLNQVTTSVNSASVAPAPVMISHDFSSIQYLQLDSAIPPYMQQQLLQKVEQMKQNFAYVEQRLAINNPLQRQFLIYYIQQNLTQGLIQLNPEERSMMIQIMQQVMSPQLQQTLLVPMASQLNNGSFNSNAPMAPDLMSPQQTQEGTINAPSLTSPSVEESQRKIKHIQNLIDLWDALYPPSWAKSFGTFGD